MLCPQATPLVSFLQALFLSIRLKEGGIEGDR